MNGILRKAETHAYFVVAACVRVCCNGGAGRLGVFSAYADHQPKSCEV
ncbi:hypothetical protein BIFCAT_01826 [Bifidobacterium catenulatum DSM 16992 = JCM 1194 = LMG 11043]|uniref:Uncharacterized protein n=1 Tax=Bifidobacterium catenulatum DSM 16992 = JCM 1194 = LMG 11043 TaxID=566552 RepID=B6XXF2_9BIFI|nr:hypothetical protein BIFCAT_01826 [Bifidobacterium catenulatum DSM 16992 = JCM 1194 = LMG 11043]